MSVVAKLYCASVKRGAGTPDAVEVTLAAVTRGDENKSWAEATPAAQFQMTIQNPQAVSAFRLGQEFLVTFEPTGTPARLEDGHEYEPSEYERDHPGGTHHRCQACGAKRQSHEEPLRSQLAEWRP